MKKQVKKLVLAKETLQTLNADLGSALGGSGTVLGTVLGALVIQFLESGLLLLDVDIGWRMVIVGQVLIAAVVFDVLFRRATGERVA